MAKLPRIDLTEFLALLKAEGKGELRIACTKALGDSGRKILTEWDNVIKGLDDIIPKLAEGAEAGQLVAPAKAIGKSAAALSLMTSQVLSFVPGPIGMVCSAVNAVVCFTTLPFPVNLGNGFLELLGCIPGGKVAGKLAPKVEKILLRTIEKTPGLRELLIKQQQIEAAVKRFARRANPPQSTSIRATPSKIPSRTSTTTHLDAIMKENRYKTGEIKKGTGSIFSPETLHEGNQIPRRQQTIPGSGTILPKKGNMTI